MKKTSRYFYTGLLSLLPLVLTVSIFNWLFKIALKVVRETFITKLIAHALIFIYGNNISQVHFKILTYLASIFIIIAFICLIGLTAKLVIVDKIFLAIKKIFLKLPLIKHVYTTISQIVDIISKDTTKIYKKVVALEYPRKGIYSIGFVTSENNIALEKLMQGKKLCNVFVPTSPNPTSGMIVCVPREELIFMDIPVEDAFKFIVSGGFISNSSDLEDIKNEKE